MLGHRPVRREGLAGIDFERRAVVLDRELERLPQVFVGKCAVIAKEYRENCEAAQVDSRIRPWWSGSRGRYGLTMSPLAVVDVAGRRTTMARMTVVGRFFVSSRTLARRESGRASQGS